MNIIFELFVLPIVVLCEACIVLCDYHNNEITKKVFNSILSIVGLIMVYYAFKGFFNNIQNIRSIEFWKSMLLEIVCVLSVIPMILYFKWYLICENIGIKTQVRSELSRILIYIIIFKNYKFNRNKILHILNNISGFGGTKSLKDLDERIKHILYKENVVYVYNY